MDYKCTGLFLDLLFYSIELYVFFIFLCQYHTALSPVAFKLESMNFAATLLNFAELCNFDFLFQCCLVILGPSYFYVILRSAC